MLTATALPPTALYAITTSPDDRCFSTLEVCRLTGMTYRQVDYLAPHVEQGDIGVGRRRRWEPLQVVRVWVSHKLMVSGMRRDHAAAVANQVALGDAYVVVRPTEDEPLMTSDVLDVLDALAGEMEGVAMVLAIPPRLVGLAGGRSAQDATIHAV